MKRSILHYSAIGLLCAMLGFTYTYHWPQLKTHLLVTLHDFTDKHLPVRVRAKDLEFTLWPVGVSLSQIVITPKKDLAKIIEPIRIQRLRVGWSWLNLFSGRLHQYQILVLRPEVAVTIPKTNKSDDKIRLPTQQLLNLPIEQLALRNGFIQIKFADQPYMGEVNNLSLNLHLNKKTLLASLSTPEVRARLSKKPGDDFQLAIETKVLLEEDAIQVSSLKVQRGESFFAGTGKISGDLQAGNFEDVFAKTRIHSDLNEVSSWTKKFSADTKLPALQGSLDAQIDLQKKVGSPLSASGVLKAAGLTIDEFQPGSLVAEVEWTKPKITAPRLAINNDAGRITIQGFELNMEDNWAIKGNVGVPNLELSRLLSRLGVKNVPVHLDISGGLPCSGTLKPDFLLKCTGELKASNLHVRDGIGSNAKTIVKTKPILINGSVEVDSKAVRPKAELRVGASRGSAEGYVDFKEGFYFKYSTPSLAFSEIENLADLKFEGSAALEGSTEGDSDRATIDMSITTKDFWFEDYAVGNATSHLKYRAGTLSFPDLNGKLESSRYNGVFDIDLNNKRLKANIKIPHMEIHDLQQGLSRKAQLPFLAFGSGSGQLSVEGPFEFTELTYDLVSSFQRGVVAGEKFDSARFDIHARKGRVQTDFVQVKRGGAVATMEGKGFPDGNIALKINSQGLRLEEFDFISSANIYLSGLLNLNMSLNGYIFKPATQLKGTITDVYIGTDRVGDSVFDIELAPKYLRGTASIFGNTIHTNFEIPFELGSRFAIDFSANNWHFAPLFAMLSGTGANRQGYQTEFTGRIRLAEENGNWKRMSGDLETDRFRVRRGSLEMAAVRPIRAKMRDGKLTIDSFQIQGDNTQLTMEARNSTFDKFDVSLNGNIDMSLLAFLTPFFQDMRGKLSLATHLGGSTENIELLGSAFIEKGYVKTRTFPHPVEEIKSDVLFSQKKVIVNSMTGNFAGGRVFADGHVQLDGYKNFPTRLNVRLEDTTIRVPEGYASRGSGSFTLTGNWFPYLMVGNYEVKEGLLDRDFEAMAAPTTGVKRSSFLPKLILRDNFDVVQMNLQTKITGNYQVRNKLMNTGVEGALNIRGTPDNPIVLGELKTTKGGQVFFRETPFDIQVATVKFEDPTELNPIMYLTGRSRVSKYDVTMLFQGTMKDYKLALTSQPPLPELDIIHLLSLGLTSEQLQQQATNTEEATTGVGIQVGGQLIGSELKKVAPIKGLDFKIAPEADDIRNTTVNKAIVTYKINDKTTLSGSRAIGSSQSEDYKLKYQINDSVSAIGIFEKAVPEEQNKSTQQDQKTKDSMGLDLEWRFEW